MKPFDPTKPVQTRDGRKARIVCMNADNSRYPIVALVTLDGQEYPYTYTACGKYRSTNLFPHNLINNQKKNL